MSHRKSKKHTIKSHYEENADNNTWKSEQENNNKSNFETDANINEDIFSDISYEDIQALALLGIQLRSVLVDFGSLFVSWNATLQGIQLVLQNYTEGEKISAISQDYLVLEGSYRFLLTKLCALNNGFIRFNTLVNKKRRGEFNYSLEPNMNINIANILSIIASFYYIKAAYGFIRRDAQLPIIGYR